MCGWERANVKITYTFSFYFCTVPLSHMQMERNTKDSRSDAMH